VPTYGYRCTNCGHQFEIFQRMSDDALKVCPNCSQSTLKKVLYPIGVSFKGSGFYSTDYKSAGKSSSSSSSGNGSGPAESKGDAKAEPKGESKSESKPESKSGSGD
jgi:putative FmdB family regulatory protein